MALRRWASALSAEKVDVRSGPNPPAPFPRREGGVVVREGAIVSFSPFSTREGGAVVREGAIVSVPAFPRREGGVPAKRVAGVRSVPDPGGAGRGRAPADMAGCSVTGLFC